MCRCSSALGMPRMKDARSDMGCSGEAQVYQSRRGCDKSGADAARGKAMRPAPGRKFFVQLMTAGAALALAGCVIVSDPPRSTVVQNVEFLRGCWVSKTAPGGTVT